MAWNQRPCIDSILFHEYEKLKKLHTPVTIERVKQFSHMFDEDKADRNDALRIADLLRIQLLQCLTRTR